MEFGLLTQRLMVTVKIGAITQRSPLLINRATLNGEGGGGEAAAAACLDMLLASSLFCVHTISVFFFAGIILAFFFFFAPCLAAKSLFFCETWQLTAQPG